MVTGILDGTYPPNSSLPPERALAEALGITRPTLRETLQRLGREGWLCIRHGKPTRVNDYRRTGGLKLLGTLAKYSDYLPERLIEHLLEFRSVFMPPAAAAAAAAAPEILVQFLENTPEPANPLYVYLLNDFAPLYNDLAGAYFARVAARDASHRYYRALRHALPDDIVAVRETVVTAMAESIDIWVRMDMDNTPPHRL